MDKKGLVIGIDYTDRFCQAAYYSERHKRAESVGTGTDEIRYLIPTVMCYDPDIKDFIIGSRAYAAAQGKNLPLYKEFLKNVRERSRAFIDGRDWDHTELLSVFFGKLIEYIRLRTSVMRIESITVTVKQVTKELKAVIEEALMLAGIEKAKIRLMSYGESFACFLIHEEESLWKKGAMLFDFDEDGFTGMTLRISDQPERPLIFVDEYDCSAEFSVRDLASEVTGERLDEKLSMLYERSCCTVKGMGVYFTGEGFSEPWFKKTLRKISAERRAFRGNNIYVKGACIAGYDRSFKEYKEPAMICRGRVKNSISVMAADKGEKKEILLSPAAVDWYEAFGCRDFILENEHSIVILIRSVISGESTEIVFDLTGIEQRPVKASRIRISVIYINERECEITVTDMGFGEFFPSSDIRITKRLDLEGQI